MLLNGVNSQNYITQLVRKTEVLKWNLTGAHNINFSLHVKIRQQLNADHDACGWNNFPQEKLSHFSYIYGGDVSYLYSVTHFLASQISDLRHTAVCNLQF